MSALLRVYEGLALVYTPDKLVSMRVYGYFTDKTIFHLLTLS